MDKTCESSYKTQKKADFGVQKIKKYIKKRQRIDKKISNLEKILKIMIFSVHSQVNTTSHFFSQKNGPKCTFLLE